MTPAPTPEENVNERPRKVPCPDCIEGRRADYDRKSRCHYGQEAMCRVLELLESTQAAEERAKKSEGLLYRLGRCQEKHDGHVSLLCGECHGHEVRSLQDQRDALAAQNEELFYILDGLVNKSIVREPSTGDSSDGASISYEAVWIKRARFALEARAVPPTGKGE